MTLKEKRRWLETDLPKYSQLTEAVVHILETLLQQSDVRYLSVTGRTKSVDGTLEKIRRKGYSDPKQQLTDLSGIRVIVHLESQVTLVSRIIQEAFCVDAKNSMQRDDVLPTNEVGYRSAHFVCELGANRTALPDYRRLTGLKFEIQLRTVLQHAWAELSHDRYYKFFAKLPNSMERELYLYAGLLEIADKSLNTLASKIDAYAIEVREKTKLGVYDIGLDAFSLQEFVNSWCKSNRFKLEETPLEGEASTRLIPELQEYGITTVQELRQVIPPGYATAASDLGYRTNIYGLVRDWMMLHNLDHYQKNAWKQRWHGFGDEDEALARLVYARVTNPSLADRILATFAYPHKTRSSARLQRLPEGTMTPLDVGI